MTTTTDVATKIKDHAEEMRAAFVEEFGHEPVRGEIGDWDVDCLHNLQYRVLADDDYDLEQACDLWWATFFKDAR